MLTSPSACVWCGVQTLFCLRPSAACCLLLLPLVLSLLRSSSTLLSGCRTVLLLSFATLLAYSFSDSTAPHVLLACTAAAAALSTATLGWEEDLAPWLSTLGLLVAEQWMRRPTRDYVHA